MSNIERKYAYYDEGVLPEVGENGVTYLTLYSSDAGNIYDGWIYDPDNKIPVSVTERTFGYRRPESPQYCWDDEVVVDLSNAQNRKESSEYAQGRIASFNTNVSSAPIILQDIDITALTESEREAKATTVLFTAIPLVSDAYIQAMVEVQMKVNLSENNTSGMVRVEAFYILNDESDRAMRPNPVHTFMVGTQNERHTLPWIYYNPALNHDVSNYIGVKLLCTGGTAEIGISDNPDYGDAMIILTSAGLTGDNVYTGQPVALEIFGLDEVAPGYELDADDYTVLCTYDTDEVYDVTRLCTFSPAMGTEIVDPVTTLTAYYQGLSASMQIEISPIDYIELTGNQDIYDSYTLDISDYMVKAYLINGEEIDITNLCTYSPAMGTILTADTTLTATYSAPGGLVYTDDLLISKATVISTYGDPSDGLAYTLYSNSVIEVTGNADAVMGPNATMHLVIAPPYEMKSDLQSQSMDNYLLKWNGEGSPCGFYLSHLIYQVGSDMRGCVRGFKGFDDIKIVPALEGSEYDELGSDRLNALVFGFSNQKYITSEMMSDIFSKVDTEHTHNVLRPALHSTNQPDVSNCYFGQAFYKCIQLTNLDFMRYVENCVTKNYVSTFSYCTALSDISGLTNIDVSEVDSTANMFSYDTALKSAGALFKWKLVKCRSTSEMFANSGLETTRGLGQLEIGRNIQTSESTNMFYNTKITELESLGTFLDNSSVNDVYGMYASCYELENISTLLSWGPNVSRLIRTGNMFYEDSKINDITPVYSWTSMSNNTNLDGMFGGTRAENVNGLNGWILNGNADVKRLLATAIFTGTPLADEYIGPSINDASQIQWSGLSFANVFGTYSSTSSPKIVYHDGHIPGYENVRTAQTQLGTFSGLDAHYYSGTLQFDSVNKIITGTVTVNFCFSSRLPGWYKQLLVDGWNDYYTLYAARLNYTYAGQYVLGN